MDLANSLRNMDRSGTHRTDEIQQEIDQLSNRDWQLWSIGILLMLVFASGFLALVLPNLAWSQRNLILDHRFVPQLMFGLITLVVLVNIYLISQRKSLNSTRGSLIRELVYNQRLENLSLYDRLPICSTAVPWMNSSAVKSRASIGRDAAHVPDAGHRWIPCRQLQLRSSSWRRCAGRYGADAEKQLPRCRPALPLRRDEFLVVMPETSEEQAEIAVRRLLRGVESWNVNSKRGSNYRSTGA